MADIVLYDETGTPSTYTDVETLTTDTPEDGKTATFTFGKLVDGVEVDLDFSNGNQNVSAPDGELLKDLTIKKPEDLIPKNIAYGVNIAGVSGTLVDEFKRYIEGSMRTLALPNVSYVASGVFQYNNYFILVNLPDCLSVGQSAFRYCSTNLAYAFFSKCSFVGESAFWGCSKLTSARFPECETVGFDAFGGCYYLTSAYFPKVSLVGGRAFENCYRMENFDFANVTDIGTIAFANCSMLKEVYAPKFAPGSSYWRNVWTFLSCLSLSRVYMPNLSYTATSMFQSCSNLQQVSLPKCISIASSVFRSCPALTSLYLLGSSVPVLPYYWSNVFTGTPIEGGGAGKIYVKESMADAFKKATGFMALSSKIVGLTDEEIENLDHWWEKDSDS